MLNLLQKISWVTLMSIIASISVGSTGCVASVDETDELGEEENISVVEQGQICNHPYDGADPYTAGCDIGAYWVNSNNPVYIPGTGISVQLWYSPNCGTNWARLHSSTIVPYMMAKVVRQESAEYCRAAYNFYWTNGTWVYSDMVYAPTALAKACGTTTTGTPKTWTCTGWY
jgi:hypothetical protein